VEFSQPRAAFEATSRRVDKIAKAFRRVRGRRVGCRHSRRARATANRGLAYAPRFSAPPGSCRGPALLRRARQQSSRLLRCAKTEFTRCIFSTTRCADACAELNYEKSFKPRRFGDEWRSSRRRVKIGPGGAEMCAPALRDRHHALPHDAAQRMPEGTLLSSLTGFKYPGPGLRMSAGVELFARTSSSRARGSMSW